MRKGLNCTRRQGMRLIPYHGYDEVSQQLELEIVLFDNKVNNPSRCLLIVNDWSSCELRLISQPLPLVGLRF